MKKRKFAGGALALALALLLTLGLFPQFPVEAAYSNVEGVKITYQLDGVTSVAKGMPFGATFTFDFSNVSIAGDAPDHLPSPSGATVVVSASGVALSQKTFTLTDVERTEEDPNGDKYSIYIPEQYMTNTGRSPATLKFTITWKDNDVTTYRAYGQKTITECVVEEGTSSESPEEKSGLMVENYSVNKQDLREGNTFDLAITIKNNGQTACSNVAVVLPTLEQITVNGKLNAQVIASLPAGATATVTFPMICAASMTTGNISIPIAVSSDEVAEKTTNAFVYVTGTAGTESESPSSEQPVEMKPVIILESYDYGGQAVLGGKEFELTMNFKNTSRNQTIENAVIKVSSVTNDAGAGAAFPPANSSSPFSIEGIDSGQSV